MTTIVTGLVAIALLLVAIRVLERSAPEGYEDDEGFHFGRPPAPGKPRRRR